jgi:hypothetical protein
MVNKHWTARDLDLIRRMSAAGQGAEVIAFTLGRTVRMVRARAKQLGISFRKETLGGHFTVKRSKKPKSNGSGVSSI